MKILVCAFPAYADHPSNPAEQILARLNRPNVETLLLPFSWKRSEEALRKALAEKNPDGVLILNVSPFRHSPTLEQFAYNEEYETSLPDADEETRAGQEVVPGAAHSLRVRFDVSHIVEILLQEGVYSSISMDGGRFMDNAAYFLALNEGKDALLVHIPLENDFPLRESDDMVDALLRVVEEEL